MSDMDFLIGLDDNKHLVRERSLHALVKGLEEGAPFRCRKYMRYGTRGGNSQQFTVRMLAQAHGGLDLE
eukprot:1182710-Prorocentrum_minimum.AAC.3